MNSQTPPKTITLEDITQMKEEKLKEIEFQKEAMTRTTRRIFAPIGPATSKADSLMRSFNTGMAVFDGVMLGFKILKKIRLFFRGAK